MLVGFKCYVGRIIFKSIECEELSKNHHNQKLSTVEKCEWSGASARSTATSPKPCRRISAFFFFWTNFSLTLPLYQPPPFPFLRWKAVFTIGPPIHMGWNLPISIFNRRIILWLSVQHTILPKYKMSNDSHNYKSKYKIKQRERESWFLLFDWLYKEHGQGGYNNYRALASPPELHCHMAQLLRLPRTWIITWLLKLSSTQP